MIPPHLTDAQRADRVRALLALEISRIVEDLGARRDFLLKMWGVHRKREPFLDTLFHRWATLPMPLLAELEIPVVTVVETFFREVEEFKLYLSFTQDMPTTLEEEYDWMVKRIAAYADIALEALGGVPERPMVAFDDEKEAEHAHVLLQFPNPKQAAYLEDTPLETPGFVEVIGGPPPPEDEEIPLLEKNLPKVPKDLPSEE